MEIEEFCAKFEKYNRNNDTKNLVKLINQNKDYFRMTMYKNLLNHEEGIAFYYPYFKLFTMLIKDGVKDDIVFEVISDYMKFLIGDVKKGLTVWPTKD